jgi:hypothetical protein
MRSPIWSACAEIREEAWSLMSQDVAEGGRLFDDSRLLRAARHPVAMEKASESIWLSAVFAFDPRLDSFDEPHQMI